jgi:hypothetical protein
MRKKPRLNLSDFPPSNDDFRIRREREEGPPLCPSCGMDEALPVASHAPPCELRKLAKTPWRPPVEAEPEAAPVRSATVPSRVLAVEAPAPFATDTPARSGEQLALLALPDVPMANPARAVAERGRSRALSFEQMARPPVCEVAVNITGDVDVRFAINITRTGHP